MKQESAKQNNGSLIKMLIPVGFFIMYGILDYLNVPYLIGISVDRINMDFFSVLLNATIVISLYIATYTLVDRREIQKDKNARDTADVLLLCTYKECLGNLNMVCNTAWVEKYIIPKIDGDKPANDNRVISNVQTLPFESKQELLELSKGGHLKKDMLKKYIQIEKDYKHVISMKITFFDLLVPKTEGQRLLVQSINEGCDKLMLMIKEEIERLEQES